MSPRLRSSNLIILAILAGFTFASCGKAAESIGENLAEEVVDAATDGEVAIDVEEDGSVSLESEDGETSIEVAAEDDMATIPEDWPAEFVIPDGIHVVRADKLDMGDGFAYSIVFDGGEDFTTLRDHFVGLDIGHPIDSQFEPEGEFSSLIMSWSNGTDVVGSVTLGESEEDGVIGNLTVFPAFAAG